MIYKVHRWASMYALGQNDSLVVEYESGEGRMENGEGIR